ncbi:hypothetical protein [Helicobacter pylori]|uniref:hypothetical protein n=1 Tax=Helicobacter pylori TaxID=210 RepID=UPI001F2780F3|nr:hypothetical protein [Helicobacter pylori]
MKTKLSPNISLGSPIALAVRCFTTEFKRKKCLGDPLKTAQEKEQEFLAKKPLARFYDNRFSHLFADFISMH